MSLTQKHTTTIECVDVFDQKAGSFCCVYNLVFVSLVPYIAVIKRPLVCCLSFALAFVGICVKYIYHTFWGLVSHIHELV